MHFDLVLKHETGLEKGLWLLEKRDLLCSCTVQERRDPFENAKCYSRGRIAFESVYAWQIGPETHNGARKESAVAKIFEKYCCLDSDSHAKQGKVTLCENDCLRLALLNAFGPCMRKRVLGRSGN
jgi:hypothetical protein